MDETEQRIQKNPSIWGQLIFNNSTKIIKQKKNSVPTNRVLGQPNSHMQKEEARTLTHNPRS